jgi:hypothetical protein
MRRVTVGPDIEVSGNSLSSILEGFGVFRSLAMQVLRTHGIVVYLTGKDATIDITKWYPLAKFLDAIEDISNRIGARIMNDIGQSVPKNAKFPPSIKDLDMAVRAIDVAFHMNHRKGGVPMFDPKTGKMVEGIGHYGYQRLGSERKITSVCDNPYPCQLDLGLLTAMSKKFELSPLVSHDDRKPCRSKGGSSCTYIITW